MDKCSLRIFSAIILPSFLVITAVLSAPFPYGKLRSPREKGCYYLLKHYQNGEQIETNEPCLNCTCVNSMLMCYLRVCPFIRPIGERCIVEKVPGECCPKIICPDASEPDPEPFPDPEPEVTSPSTTTTTTMPTTTEAEDDGAGCYLNGKHYREGSEIPSDKLCEVCYCIRNTSACVMHECALHVSGCKPIYTPGICCPTRYNCTEEAATTVPPHLREPLDNADGCTIHGRHYVDGEPIKSSDPCEHCYCMRNEVVCAVQECKPPCDGCVPIPNHSNKCCPERYECAAPTRTVPPNNIIVGSTTPLTSTTESLLPFSKSEEFTDINSTEIMTSSQSPSPLSLSTTIDLLENNIKSNLSSSPATFSMSEDNNSSSTKSLEIPFTESSIVSSTDPSISSSAFTTISLSTHLTTTLQSNESSFDQENTTSIAFSRRPIFEDTPSQARKEHDPDDRSDYSHIPTGSTTKIFTTRTSTQSPRRPSSIPGLIPGEGICRLDGKIYENSAEVPSNDSCIEFCICINSVIYCDEIVCEPHKKDPHVICTEVKDNKACCPQYKCRISPESSTEYTSTPSSTTKLVILSTSSLDKKISTLIPILDTLDQSTTTTTTISSESIHSSPKSIENITLADDIVKSTFSNITFSSENLTEIMQPTQKITFDEKFTTTTSETVEAASTQESSTRTSITTTETQDIYDMSKIEHQLTLNKTDELDLSTTTQVSFSQKDVSQQTYDKTTKYPDTIIESEDTGTTSYDLEKIHTTDQEIAKEVVSTYPSVHDHDFSTEKPSSLVIYETTTTKDSTLEEITKMPFEHVELTETETSKPQEYEQDLSTKNINELTSSSININDTSLINETVEVTETTFESTTFKPTKLVTSTMSEHDQKITQSAFQSDIKTATTLMSEYDTTTKFPFEKDYNIETSLKPNEFSTIESNYDLTTTKIPLSDVTPKEYLTSALPIDITTSTLIASGETSDHNASTDFSTEIIEQSDTTTEKEEKIPATSKYEKISTSDSLASKNEYNITSFPEMSTTTKDDFEVTTEVQNELVQMQEEKNKEEEIHVSTLTISNDQTLPNTSTVKSITESSKDITTNILQAEEEFTTEYPGKSKEKQDLKSTTETSIFQTKDEEEILLISTTERSKLLDKKTTELESDSNIDKLKMDNKTKSSTPVSLVTSVATESEPIIDKDDFYENKTYDEPKEMFDEVKEDEKDVDIDPMLKEVTTSKVNENDKTEKPEMSEKKEKPYKDRIEGETTTMSSKDNTLTVTIKESSLDHKDVEKGYPKNDLDSHHEVKTTIYSITSEPTLFTDSTTSYIKTEKSSTKKDELQDITTTELYKEDIENIIDSNTLKEDKEKTSDESFFTTHMTIAEGVTELDKSTIIPLTSTKMSSFSTNLDDLETKFSTKSDKEINDFEKEKGEKLSTSTITTIDSNVKIIDDKYSSTSTENLLDIKIKEKSETEIMPEEKTMTTLSMGEKTNLDQKREESSEKLEIKKETTVGIIEDTTINDKSTTSSSTPLSSDTTYLKIEDEATTESHFQELEIGPEDRRKRPQSDLPTTTLAEENIPSETTKHPSDKLPSDLLKDEMLFEISTKEPVFTEKTDISTFDKEHKIKDFTTTEKSHERTDVNEIDSSQKIKDETTTASFPIGLNEKLPSTTLKTEDERKITILSTFSPDASSEATTILEMDGWLKNDSFDVSKEQTKSTTVPSNITIFDESVNFSTSFQNVSIKPLPEQKEPDVEIVTPTTISSTVSEVSVAVTDSFEGISNFNFSIDNENIIDFNDTVRPIDIIPINNFNETNQRDRMNTSDFSLTSDHKSNVSDLYNVTDSSNFATEKITPISIHDNSSKTSSPTNDVKTPLIINLLKEKNENKSTDSLDFIVEPFTTDENDINHFENISQVKFDLDTSVTTVTSFDNEIEKEQYKMHEKDNNAPEDLADRQSTDSSIVSTEKTNFIDTTLSISEIPEIKKITTTSDILHPDSQEETNDISTISPVSSTSTIKVIEIESLTKSPEDKSHTTLISQTEITSTEKSISFESKDSFGEVTISSLDNDITQKPINETTSTSDNLKTFLSTSTKSTRKPDIETKLKNISIEDKTTKYAETTEPIDKISIINEEETKFTKKPNTEDYTLKSIDNERETQTVKDDLVQSSTPININLKDSFKDSITKLVDSTESTITDKGESTISISQDKNMESFTTLPTLDSKLSKENEYISSSNMTIDVKDLDSKISTTSSSEITFEDKFKGTTHTLEIKEQTEITEDRNYFTTINSLFNDKSTTSSSTPLSSDTTYLKIEDEATTESHFQELEIGPEDRRKRPQSDLPTTTLAEENIPSETTKHPSDKLPSDLLKDEMLFEISTKEPVFTEKTDISTFDKEHKIKDFTTTEKSHERTDVNEIDSSQKIKDETTTASFPIGLNEKLPSTTLKTEDERKITILSTFSPDASSEATTILEMDDFNISHDEPKIPFSTNLLKEHETVTLKPIYDTVSEFSTSISSETTNFPVNQTSLHDSLTLFNSTPSDSFFDKIDTGHTSSNVFSDFIDSNDSLDSQRVPENAITLKPFPFERFGIVDNDTELSTTLSTKLFEMHTKIKQAITQDVSTPSFVLENSTTSSIPLNKVNEVTNGREFTTTLPIINNISAAYDVIDLTKPSTTTKMSQAKDSIEIETTTPHSLKDSMTTHASDFSSEHITTITDYKNDNKTFSSQECVFADKVYQSAEQIPRPHPCDFCFCFRGDIICLQQTCPPPIPGCFETSIQGFCCPRYECPVHISKFNITSTTPIPLFRKTTQITACEINGQYFEIGQVIKPSSGPCMECKCGTDGVMRCNPQNCSPQPPLLLRMNRSYFAKR